MQTFFRPRGVIQVVKPFPPPRIPAPKVRVNAARVAVVFYCFQELRAGFRHPVRRPPRFLDLRVGAQEPVELNPDSCLVFELSPEKLEVFQTDPGSLPPSRTGMCFTVIRFDVNQEQNGPPLSVFQSAFLQYWLESSVQMRDVVVKQMSDVKMQTCVYCSNCTQGCVVQEVSYLGPASSLTIL
ncbi:MAG: hypothetical protein LZF86_50095 [Nitrospira sp.]|nr:MAG: hypothetical protein LZF86_50095 [Nitrospira sp.]